VAANTNVGVAKANPFPTIPLPSRLDKALEMIFRPAIRAQFTPRTPARLILRNPHQQTPPC
jgi:hypothetical protein